MAERVQVNVSDEMVAIIDQYAEMIGVSRSALCSIFISNGVMEYNEKMGRPFKTGTFKLTGKPGILERLEMVFDGWAGGLEGVPNWRPDLRVEDGYVWINSQKVCPVTAKVSSICCDPWDVTVYWEEDDIDYETFVDIKWSEAAGYYIGEVSVTTLK